MSINEYCGNMFLVSKPAIGLSDSSVMMSSIWVSKDRKSECNKIHMVLHRSRITEMLQFLLSEPDDIIDWMMRLNRRFEIHSWIK
uniref:Uncharacterized protein n=1 Tax=Arundo donax TaxID=35708 RepID=A0A0A9B2G5_ARUDO